MGVIYQSIPTSSKFDLFGFSSVKREFSHFEELHDRGRPIVFGLVRVDLLDFDILCAGFGEIAYWKSMCFDVFVVGCHPGELVSVFILASRDVLDFNFVKLGHEILYLSQVPSHLIFFGFILASHLSLNQLGVSVDNDPTGSSFLYGIQTCD